MGICLWGGNGQWLALDKVWKGNWMWLLGSPTKTTLLLRLWNFVASGISRLPYPVRQRAFPGCFLPWQQLAPSIETIFIFNNPNAQLNHSMVLKTLLKVSRLNTVNIFSDSEFLSKDQVKGLAVILAQMEVFVLLIQSPDTLHSCSAYHRWHFVSPWPWMINREKFSPCMRILCVHLQHLLRASLPRHNN